jgi:hypothetical protein
MTMIQPANISKGVARWRADVSPLRRLAGASAGALLLAVALVGGCFDPKIQSGNLKCAPPNNLCPDGFTCAGGVCVSKSGGKVGDAGAMDAANGDGAAGGAGGMTCANAIAPLCAPVTGAASSVCDPVCQTGCACGLRCSVGESGALCGAQVGQKTLGQICTPSSDDCAPGLACLREACGNNLGRCYRFCRDASMCAAGLTCSTEVNSSNSKMALGQLACDLAEQACDPIAGTGCPDAALSCFVTPAGRTICDCPGRRGREGDNCSYYTDCAPGLACVQSKCMRLCRSSADCAGCAVLGQIRYCPI